MKKSIFLFFAAILCAMSVQGAASKQFNDQQFLYCIVENTNWKSWGIKYNWYWDSGNWYATENGNKISENHWYAKVPNAYIGGVQFIRCSKDFASEWDWSVTKKSDTRTDNKINCAKITGSNWGNAAISWTTYAPAMSEVTLEDNGTSIVSGSGTQADPYLVYTESTIKVKAKGTKSVEDPDAKAYYDFKQATTSKQNSTTATYQFTASATVGTSYTINVDGYTKVNTTPSTTKSATALYYKTVEPAEETNDVTVSYMFGSTKVAEPTTINTVGVETPVKVTAPEIAKYTFANWTLGADVATTDALTSNEINITTKAGGSDFTLVANYEKAKLTYTVTVPAGTENCYLVGAMNGWDVENPIEMTKQGENVFTTTLEGVATTDEYKYLSKKGSWDYADVQESNRTWTANDVVTAWKDPLATNVHLVGNMFANWDKTPDKEFRKATKDATTASIVVALDANKDYELKVRRGDDWTSCTSKITNTVSNLQFSTSNNDNCKMRTTVAGDYTFTWTISSSKLAVTYPTICAITATANDAAMGTITGAGDYGKGSTATLTATPKDGYLFVNWTKGGEVVATTQEYSFEVTAAVELVANFEAAPEEVHNVTVSYVCGGNKIADDQTVAAVGETSAETAEAPEIWGYTFSSWTLGADVTTDDALTSNAIDINIVAGGSDFTLTANYTEIPKVTIYVVNNKKWSKVNVYGWDGEVGESPAWPGQEITANKESEKIAGFDVYSYSVVPGSYKKLIINNKPGDNTEQSETYTWKDGKYYYMDAAADYAGGTKEEVTKLLTPTYTVAGNNRIVFGEEWAAAKTENDMVDQGDGTYKWTKSKIALKKDTEIKFKVVKNHDWGKGYWPVEDWVINNISKDGYYTITITFKESDQSITATATWTGEAPFKDFSNQPATLYFHPSFHWTSDHAQFAAYFYNEGFGADAEPTWVNMTDDNSDGIYELANAKKHEYIIICRMNPNRTETRWNKSEDDADDAAKAKKPVWNQISTGLSIPNTAGDLNTCLAFWKNCQGDVPTSECTWVAPTPLTDKNWGDFIAAYNGETINAVVERSFKSGQYHTLCLPFDIPTDWLGEGTKAYQLTSIAANNTGDKLSLNATLWNTIVAGQPYIIVPVKGDEYEHVIINGVTVKNVSAGTNVASGDGYKATLKAVTATDGKTNGSTEYYVGANDGKLYHAEVDKLGLRAIIELTTTSGQPLPPKVRAYVAAEENEATGFENIVAPEGQVLKVIENGQLIIIRDGVKYNVQGQKL